MLQNIRRIIIALLGALWVSMSAQAVDFDTDWAQLGRYAKANAELTENPDVVFMGNSITDFWVWKMPEFWEAHPRFVDRGISGQTTCEMLVRFRQDVIDLHPKVVVILAGINDIAHNNGAISLEHVMGNIQSMIELARLNKIKVAVCSVLPCDRFAWQEKVKPAPLVRRLNDMIKAYVETRRDKNVIYVDYYTAMANENGGFPANLSTDGCHPDPAGYQIMQTIITQALHPWVK